MTDMIWVIITFVRFSIFHSFHLKLFVESELDNYINYVLIMYIYFRKSFKFLGNLFQSSLKSLLIGTNRQMRY